MGLLDKKKIIVVGGAGFLGSAICDAIIAQGADCIIADYSIIKAEIVAKDIYNKRKIRPYVVEVDINNEESVLELIEKAHKIRGGIDALINAAYPRNKNYGRKFEDVEYKDFCENTNLHLGGYFLVSQKILEYFKKNGIAGSLINISSIYGVIPPRFEIYEGTKMTMPVEYAAIKAAIIHITKYMAKYYKRNNIRVNSISLGGLLDKQDDDFLSKYNNLCLNKGMLNPDDVTGTIVYLMSDLSLFVNGQNLIVDDGFTL